MFSPNATVSPGAAHHLAFLNCLVPMLRCIAVIRSCSALRILEQFRKAPDDFAGDLAADILAIVVVAHQHFDRGVPRELAGGAHIAVGLVERRRDRCVSEAMRADDAAKLCAHCLQDLVDAIAGKAAASEHAPALADLEEERSWLLAAKRNPSPQPGRHQRIEREQFALALALAQDAQAVAPRVKVLKVECDDLTASQGAAVAQQEEDRDITRRLGLCGGWAFAYSSSSTMTSGSGPRVSR